MNRPELVRLIERRPIGKKQKLRWYGLYTCPVCSKNYETLVRSVDSGRSTKCAPCARSSDNLKVAVGNALRKPLATFLAQVQEIHDYNFSKFEYTGNKAKGTVICETHGEFQITPGHLLRGQGCGQCYAENRTNVYSKRYYDPRPAMLYYVYFPEHNLWKVGVTIENIARRFRKETTKIEVVWEMQFDRARDAYECEYSLLRLVKSFKYAGSPILTNGGNTELFTKDLNSILLNLGD